MSLLPAVARAVLFSASSQSCFLFRSFSLLLFFSVNSITHEPLHLAWWNFAWTCTLTTSRSPSNIEVIGQGHMNFLCVRYCLNQLAWIHEHRHSPRAVLSLEQRLLVPSFLFSGLQSLSVDDCWCCKFCYFYTFSCLRATGALCYVHTCLLYTSPSPRD